MTPKQKRFVDEYLIDLNATQAAIRAGYSSKTARQQGAENLTKPVIREAIRIAMEKRAEKAAIDAEYVLHRHIEIDQMDVADVLNDDGTIKPLSEWPKIWRTSLTGFEVSETMVNGDSIGTLKKIKWMDKTQNLAKLGQHVDVQAYKEKVEHSGSVDLVEVLDERRKNRESRR
jgi:phage terminase small subunit